MLMHDSLLHKKAPDFTLPDYTGALYSLKDFQGGWIILYFYPKDDTPGCTKEACNFREMHDDLENADIKVIGVSIDSQESHKEFIEKYNLPFLLLSDENKEVVELYKVWGKKEDEAGHENMQTNRVSFLINPEGEIVKIYDNMDVEHHAEEVLEDVKEMEQE